MWPGLAPVLREPWGGPTADSAQALAVAHVAGQIPSHAGRELGVLLPSPSPDAHLLGDPGKSLSFFRPQFPIQ